MRDIIFRGKRIDNGEWVYGNYFHYNNKNYNEGLGCFYIQTKLTKETLIEDFEVIPETIGQYTGLNDKNGNKVFEGDIIAFNPRRFANNRVFYYTRSSGFYLTKSMDEPKPCDINPFFSDDCYKYEVIGNVFDNPELMEVDKN